LVCFHRWKQTHTKGLFELEDEFEGLNLS